MHVQRAFLGLLAPATLACVLAGLQAGPSHADWTQTNGPRGGSVRAFLAVPNGTGGTSLYTGGVRVWRTDDQGASWTHLPNGLTDVNAFTLLAVPNGSGGNDLLVGTGNGVFRSANNGASWSPSNNGLPANLSIYSLASGPDGSGGTNLYGGAGGFVGQVFRSTDNGASWTSMSSGLAVGQGNINALTTTAAGTVLAGTGNGIYRTTNFGASWTKVMDRYGFSFARHGTTIYAGTSSGVWRSTNDGATWTALNSGMEFTWVYAVAAIPNGSGATLFASAGGVMRSTDNGATWTAVTNGLTTVGVYALTTAPNPGGGTDLYAGTNLGVFRTTNNGGNWTEVSFIATFAQALEVTPSGAVLAGTDHIFRSSDLGANWTRGIFGAPIQDFAVNPNGTDGVSLFAVGATFGILKSTDDGETWAGVTIDDIEVNSMGVVPNGSGGTNLVAGAYSGMFVSTNDGGSWLHVQPNFMGLDYVVTPNGPGHRIFGGGFNGVWLSTNGGMTWSHLALGGIVQAMAATGNGAQVFAGGDPFGVYRSTDNGATWTLVNNGLTDLRITSLVSPDGTNLIAGGAGGVFLSTDQGNSWTSVGTGLTTGVGALAVSLDGSTLLAGTGGLGVWKRPLSEMIDAPPPPPPSPPSIASFAPTSGPVGTEVTITGSNFAGTSAVRFNGTVASYLVVSGTQIRSTVPAGATTGRISVTNGAGTATSGTDFTVTVPPPPPVTLTFTPPHDAWVRSSSPTSNFGSRPELSVRSGSQTVRSYLKFNVSGLTGAVHSAKLRLRVTDGGPSGGSVFAVSNNLAGTSTPWTEGGLRWNNAPVVGGSALGTLGSVSANTWVEVDVTSAITGNGTFSFAVSGGSNNVVEYSSSEGANPPQLVVVGAGSAAETPVVDAHSSEAELVPATMILHANHPNPFRSETTIQYSLPRTMAVRLGIYDVRGRFVRTLVDGTQDAGDRRVIWDGRDGRGSLAGPGVYVVRLEADGTSLTRKMSRLR